MGGRWFWPPIFVAGLGYRQDWGDDWPFESENQRREHEKAGGGDDVIRCNQHVFKVAERCVYYIILFG